MPALTELTEVQIQWQTAHDLRVALEHLVLDVESHGHWVRPANALEEAHKLLDVNEEEYPVIDP